MTDTPRRIDPAVLDEIRARTPLAAIVGRRVKLERSGGLLRGCCPFHGERRPSFYVYPDHYHCFSCGVHGDVIRFVMDSEGVDFLAAVKQLSSAAAVDLSQPAPPVPTPAAQHGAGGDDERAERMRAHAKAIWLAAQPDIAATPVADYLAGRGIDLAELPRPPRVLRFHPALWHPWARRELPAMVAAISGAADPHVATHCTWLERIAGAGWIKARMERDRLVFGRYTGGCIHLWRGASGRPFRDALADEPVVIGEGIETCLSIVLACPELRVVAGVAKSNLASVSLPEQVRMVILAADNDEARADTDQKWRAARRMLQRAINSHVALGRHVRIARAPIGKDFNDTLQGAA